jgi:ADP-ribose pyrophosphatase YjhB (NUDIX family)
MPRLSNRYFDIDLNSGDYTDDVAVATIEQEETKWVERVHRATADKVKRSMAGIWLTVPIRQAALLPAFLERGYKVHHATQQYFKLTKAADDSGLPKFATHRVRVECLVIEEDTGYCLCVRERFGERYTGCKFVTGAVNAGETIGNAAQREVYEETHIRTRFAGVMGHEHRFLTRFNTDEFIFGCLLFAEGRQTPMMDDREIIWTEWQSWQHVFDTGSEIMRRWLEIFGLANQGMIHLPEYMSDFRGQGKRMQVFLPYIDRIKKVELRYTR